MAQKKSEFVSAFDIAARVFKSLANAVMDEGGSDADVRRIETDGNLQKQIAELVMKGKKVVAGAVRIFVDYDRLLAGMIRDCGLDHVNSDITEKHFPINQRPNAEVEMKVFSTKDLVGEERSVTSEEVIKALAEKGYREAELPEGLAYVQANPDEQRKYPIVLLGSVWRDWSGYRHVPYLDGWRDERGLGLGWFVGDWLEDCRFLAVRK